MSDIKQMTVDELLKRVLAVHAKFPRKYDKKTQIINLMEEVGELSNAALLEAGDKPEKRRRAELADSLADVLFALIATADIYDVDLGEQMIKTLNEIEERQQAKEYEDE